MLDERTNTIVGVLQAGFAFPGLECGHQTSDDAGRARPLRRLDSSARTFSRTSSRDLNPGVSEDAANASFQTVVSQVQQEYPATNAKMGTGIVAAARRAHRRHTPAADRAARSHRTPPADRVRERGRSSAGARGEPGSRSRRASCARRGTRPHSSPALTESLVLSALGGAAGLVLGWWATGALLALRPAGLLPVSDVTVNWGVLAYVVAITAVSGALFGVAPALWSARRMPAEAMQEGGRGGTAGGRARRWKACSWRAKSRSRCCSPWAPDCSCAVSGT